MNRKPWASPFRRPTYAGALLTMHDVFTDPVRREIVSVLLEEQEVAVPVLVTHLRRRNPGSVACSNVTHAWLVHEHVLPMVDAELVSYDPEQDTVALEADVSLSLPSSADDSVSRPS